jgi:hypothetical protein
MSLHFATPLRISERFGRKWLNLHWSLNIPFQKYCGGNYSPNDIAIQPPLQNLPAPITGVNVVSLLVVSEVVLPNQKNEIFSRTAQT